MSATSLLRQVVEALDAAGVPHMLVGSFASTAYGRVRSTQDIDIVIDPDPASLASFLDSLADHLYVPASASDALHRREQFNVIDTTTTWKVDLIIRKDRPFSRVEFARRRRATSAGVPVWMATAEDSVLSKLEWAAMSDSERQVTDAASVIAVQGDTLDATYLDRWAAELGVTGLLAQARRAAAD